MQPSHRVLFVDDNVRDIGGHYLELASLLAEGARELGYEPTLVTHESFLARNPDSWTDSRLDKLVVDPRFQVRRMENWSLGVDGPSLVSRGRGGFPIGGSVVQRCLQRFHDVACRPSRRPATMLDAWSRGFSQAVRQFDPAPGDSIVINTGGDFQILALADALESLSRDGVTTPLSIHVVFHFAVFGDSVTDRAQAFGRQVNESVKRMHPHRVALHATTESLNQQLAAVGISATAIPYPTRRREVKRVGWTADSGGTPPKILLAGMPRAEKGRGQIRSLLSAIERPFLRSGQFTWSMQLPKKRWQRMIPAAAMDLYRDAAERVRDDSAGGEVTAGGVIEGVHGNLDSEHYHDWLDGADVGLFLYDPDRYVARCSGVLLEMMIRGVPVIVPDRCWLADQVRSVQQPIGWVYQSTEEIPAILEQLPSQLDQVACHCRAHAQHVAEFHSGRNTLQQMGLAGAGSLPVRRAG